MSDSMISARRQTFDVTDVRAVKIIHVTLDSLEYYEG